MSADVHYDEDTGTWLIQMRSSGYAFGLADGGTALRHLYWGPVPPPGAVPGLLASASRPAWERNSSWSAEEADEYVPWGGMRYDEPSLKAEYADGTRAVEWRFAGHRSRRDGPAVTLEIDLADAAYGLEVTLFYRAWDGSDVLSRWVRLRNRGADPVVLRQALSANWWLPALGSPGGEWRLRYLHGGWGHETQLAESRLGPGKLVLESRRGTTSHQLNPWFTLDAGDAGEESGEVWSGELAWSGSWKMVFETTPGGRAHASGGWNDFDWSRRLAPGEEATLPAFAGLYTGGGFGAASREWHAWQRNHVLPRLDPAAAAAVPVSVPGPPLRPVLYNSWEATTFAVDEDSQAHLAGLAARIGVECFVVDDGWFPGRHHDHAGLGDWRVDPGKFPRGLGPLIDKVRGLGMAFGLWAEPEMVNPDSDLYRAHPDWVYHFANRERTEKRNQLILNLARDDVAEWVYQTLDRLLTENDIAFVKWDMNRHFAQPGWPASAGQNPERIWTAHTESLYRILDGLRAAHPGVAFESCSGGGGRIDLGILSRTDQVWTSDNTDAWDRMRIQEGFSQAYSPQAMMAWVTDSPNPLTRRELPLSFRFHVAMAGSLGIGGHLARWSPAELDEAAGLIAAYKEIRPVVQAGALYRLASAFTGQSGAVQYTGDGGADIVVLAWWEPRRYGTPPPRVRLAALDPAARYADAETGAVHLGATLLRDGLDLPGADGHGYGSALIRLRRAV